jgi:hypothetical protein
MFAGALGHGGVQGRPMRKLDHCCRSRTPTTVTTTSSCRHSRSRRHRRRRCRSTRKPDRYCRSRFLFLELHHPIRRTKASSTRSTNWISAVCSSSSFSTVLFCLGSEERRKQLTAERHGSGQSPRVTTPCTVQGSGEERGYRGKCTPTPSFFPSSLATTTGEATMLLCPPFSACGVGNRVYWRQAYTMKSY